MENQFHDTHTEHEFQNDKYFGYELARKRDRLIGSLLQGIIVELPKTLITFIVLDFFSSWLLRYTVERSLFLTPLLILFLTIFTTMIGAIFYPLWSGNLGHKIMGLKVISSIDGQDQKSSLQGALREGLKSILGFVLVPVIWLLWDKDKQNLYDKIVKTYVVKKKKQ